MKLTGHKGLPGLSVLAVALAGCGLMPDIPVPEGAGKDTKLPPFVSRSQIKLNEIEVEEEEERAEETKEDLEARVEALRQRADEEIPERSEETDAALTARVSDLQMRADELREAELE